MTIQILTKRTKLRLLDFEDLESIHELHSFPETDEYNTLGIPENKAETKSTIEPWIAENNKSEIKNHTFVIENKQDQFLGLFGLKLAAKKYKSAEVWYKIHPRYWNCGIATEVLDSIIDFGFSKLALHRIHAGCAVNNIGSIKVLEKVGMRYEGRHRQILPLKTGWSDNYEYAILESDRRKIKVK